MSQPLTAVQSQKAVYAYFTSKQILPFGFAGKMPSLTVINHRHLAIRENWREKGWFTFAVNSQPCVFSIVFHGYVNILTLC